MGLVPMMLFSQQLLGILLVTIAHGGIEVGADRPQPPPTVTSGPINITSRMEVGADGPQPTSEVTSEPLNIIVSNYCPISFSPPTVVVEYGEPVSVNCFTNITHEGLSWEVFETEGEMTEYVSTLTLNETTDWEIESSCAIIYNKTRCSKNLTVTIYKTPDSVSISIVDNKIIEGFQYELQCEIVNVAPVKSLIVKWFKGETGVYTETFNDTTKTPVNVTSKLQITADRNDDGVQYRCEAELELGADGPQPPPKMTSEPLNITVSSLSSLLQLFSQTVVVEYGSSVSVNCSTDVTHDGIGWNASDGAVPETRDKLVTWKVSNLRRWDIRPKCYINYKTKKHETELPVTVYKTPDIVSINTVDHTGPMINGSQYELQCNIVNVAPVKSLTVKWFKGETEVHTETYTDAIKTPVTKTSTLQITADRDNDGAQYRCEAELKLGADVPQPPPKVTSESLNITVYSICDFLQFNPPSVVVRYDSSVSVDCSTNFTHDGIGWESSVGSVSMTREKLITWRVSNLRRWDIQPICYISTNWTKCVSLLPVLIYKTPDSVSISTVDNKIIEGFQYELHCEIVNVAPVKSLIVKWFKGETEVHSETFNDIIKTPVNKTSKLTITPNKARDDGAQYRCEAELNLGADGPQPPPKVKSEPLRITVNNICALLQFSPPSVVVEYGSSVSVDCSTNVTHDGIGWEASVEQVSMIKAKLVTWRVSNLRTWDIRPQCYINYNRDQCLTLLPVTIYKTPDSVSIKTVNHTGPMTEGSQYELQCDIVNVAPKNLTVKWFNGKTEVHSKTFNDTIKTPVNVTSTLQITADRDNDGAQYRCKAELKLGADGPQPPPKVTSEPLDITVHYEPQISSCNDWAPKTGTLLSSHSSSLYSIVGNPRPDITWRLGSSFINDHKIFNKNDSGQYTITASNTNGESSCNISITVEYPPSLDCSENYQIKENALFKFPCLADGLPKSDVSVYKDDGKVIQFPFTPRWNDSGLYKVTASNKHGYVNRQFKLNILHAPVFDTVEDIVEFVVHEGSNITLKCISFGNPEPNTWWSFKNHNISTGRSYNTINITKATSADAGDYTCRATNQFGRKDKIFTVEIKENSRIYIYVICIVLALVLLLIILLCLWMWKRSKSRGFYPVQHELRPLTNGNTK